MGFDINHGGDRIVRVTTSVRQPWKDSGSHTHQARSHTLFQPLPSLPPTEETPRPGEFFAFFAPWVTGTTDPQHEPVLELTPPHAATVTPPWLT